MNNFDNMYDEYDTSDYYNDYCKNIAFKEAYENFLIDFLDDESTVEEYLDTFVKEKVHFSKKYQEYTIIISDIEKRFTENQIEYILYYLQKKNIKVVGESTVYNAFDNYRQDRSFYDRLRLQQENQNENNKYSKIIRNNYSLVIIICKRYIKFGLSLEELISYAVEGMIIAIDKYDSSKAKFSTFATHCMKKKIRKGIAESKGYPINLYQYHIKKTDGYKQVRYWNSFDEYILSLMEEGNLQEEIKKRFLFHMPLSLDECQNILDSKEFEKQVWTEYFIDKVISKYDKYDEVASYYGIKDREKPNLSRKAREAIRKKALTKIRKTGYLEGL